MTKTSHVLGCRIDPLTMEAALQRIEELIEAGQPSQVITLNAEIAYQAYHDRSLQDLINRAQLVTPDGIGIVWGARQLGMQVPERVTGIDLTERLCAQAARKGWQVYLLGAAPGVAEAAASQLQQRFPGLNIVGFHHGYFQEHEQTQIMDHIRRVSPDILCVGLGAPRQERWIDQVKQQLGIPVCIGVGGSLDVLSGQKPRAPQWFIRLNLEWLYRLLAEPSRVKRQMVLPRFAGLVLRTKFGQGTDKQK